MASNPQLNSDFGHYLSFCWSILVNFTKKIDPGILEIKSNFDNFLGEFCYFLVNLTKKKDLNPKKVRKYQCPKMVSKRLYSHYLRSYEQF